MNILSNVFLDLLLQDPDHLSFESHILGLKIVNPSCKFLDWIQCSVGMV